MDDAVVGKAGRVTVPVPGVGYGEIVIDEEGVHRAFTAYTLGGEELPKNARAAVIEQTGPNTVIVTGF